MSEVLTSADLRSHLSANPQTGRLLSSGDHADLGAYFHGCVLNNRLMLPVTPDLQCFRQDFGIFWDGVYDMLGRPPSPVFQRALDEPAPAGKYFAMGSYDNYYHWSMDFLPRLAIRSMLPDGDERRVIIHHPLNEWQTASLRLFLLGLQIDSLDLYLNQSEWTRYPDCFAPMPVRQKAVAIWDLVLHHTRHLLPPPNGPKRLFIMRLDSPKRVARNQEEVAAALEKLGFTCLDPGKLSFEEEIALMGNVEIVVGAFGAALTNILFAPPGSSVVEIRGTIRQPFYRHLAFWRGMRHTDIAYTEVPGTHPEMIDQDYMIPLDTLLQRLSDLGIR